MQRLPIARRASPRIARLVRAAIGPAAAADDDARFAQLVEDWLERREYERPFALRLRDLAADPAERWEARRIAALMLERELLRGDDVPFWRDELQIDFDEPSLRARMARSQRVYAKLDETSGDRAIGDFLHLASRDCRLTLARWLSTPQQVFARIDESIRRARGIRCTPDYGHRFVEHEAKAAIESVPQLERELLYRLGHKATTRWTAPQTPQTINSLIEHPLGTVVLTIKPPGSEHELEIKRAGIRGPFPLDALYERDGDVIPPSHHLQGGSMQPHLAAESSGSAVMSRLYRLVHGETAPMSRTVHTANVYGVPTNDGEVDILDYFTDPHVFGDQYGRMRKHMNLATRDLAQMAKQPRTEKPNALALTLEFLGITQPAQVVQVGTTSYRLERLGLYLGDDGDARYFEQLGVERYTRDDSRRFADELLDEILGLYEPPRSAFRSYGAYVAAALDARPNRARANAAYVDVMAQIGRFWGTVLAPRGHSHGESFVSRNCGLRAVFERGAWRVRIIFMDHDSLAFAARYETSYSPRPSVRAAMRDARFILGQSFGGVRPVRGEIDYLRDIYRVSGATEGRGLAALQLAMKDAYDKTQQAMRNDPEVARMFEPEFVARLQDWDDAVRLSLTAGRRWKADVQSTLAARGYGNRITNHFVEAIDTEQHFLRQVAFLFER